MKISKLISILQEFEDLEVYTHWEGTFHGVTEEHVYVALIESIGANQLYCNWLQQDHGPDKGRVLIIDADLFENDKAAYQKGIDKPKEEQL